jgi:hypothetical protein
MPRCKTEGRDIQGKTPLKTLDKFGCKKYAVLVDKIKSYAVRLTITYMSGIWMIQLARANGNFE